MFRKNFFAAVCSFHYIFYWDFLFRKLKECGVERHPHHHQPTTELEQREFQISLNSSFTNARRYCQAVASSQPNTNTYL